MRISDWSSDVCSSDLLGNVILLPMLLHDFSFWSLFSVPLFSLFFNCVGHANYDFFPGVSSAHWFAASRRHHLHHACYPGNYGFQFTFMDRLFRTRLQADAAAAPLGPARTRGDLDGRPQPGE